MRDLRNEKKYLIDWFKSRDVINSKVKDTVSTHSGENIYFKQINNTYPQVKSNIFFETLNSSVFPAQLK